MFEPGSVGTHRRMDRAVSHSHPVEVAFLGNHIHIRYARRIDPQIRLQFTHRNLRGRLVDTRAPAAQPTDNLLERPELRPVIRVRPMQSAGYIHPATVQLVGQVQVVTDGHDVDAVVALRSLAVPVEPREGVTRRTSAWKRALYDCDTRACLSEPIRKRGADGPSADDDDLCSS